MAVPFFEDNAFEAWGTASAKALRPESTRKPEQLDREVGAGG